MSGSKNFTWFWKNNTRGHTQAGTRVKKYLHGLAPAGEGVANVSGGKTPAGVGAKRISWGQKFLVVSDPARSG